MQLHLPFRFEAHARHEQLVGRTDVEVEADRADRCRRRAVSGPRGDDLALAPHARQFGHLGRALTDDLIACLGNGKIPLQQPAITAVREADRARRGRRDRIAFRELRIVQPRAHVDREAGIRCQADRTLRLHRAAARPRGEAGEFEPVVVEPRRDLHLRQARAEGFIIVGQIVGTDQAVELRCRDATGEVRGDCDRSGQLLVGQRG